MPRPRLRRQLAALAAALCIVSVVSPAIIAPPAVAASATPWGELSAEEWIDLNGTDMRARIDLAGQQNAILKAERRGDARAAVLHAMALYKGDWGTVDIDAARALVLPFADGSDTRGLSVLLEILIAHPRSEADRVMARELAQRMRDQIGLKTVSVYYLGRVLFEGIGGPKEIEAAMQLYREAAAAGEPMGMLMAGNVMLATPRTPGDREQGRKLIEDAARAGLPYAYDRAGEIWARGEGGPQDDSQAAAWYSRGATLGSAVSMREWGRALLLGRGTAKDTVQGLAWLERAGDKGDAEAARLLAQALDARLGGEPDPPRITALMKRAAEAGDVVAMYEYAQRLITGKGVTQDRALAMEWARKAAEGGHIVGMYRYGLAMRNGVDLPKDEAQGLVWIERAANAGNADAMMAMARWDAPERRAGWVEKAAAKGSGEAMNTLALDYGAGRGVAKDPAKSFEWAKKSAEAGFVPGMRFLADLYASSDSVRPDKVQAAYWYGRAAEGGDTRSMTKLAYSLFNGTGIEKDRSKAMTWAKAASEKGDTEAMRLLGIGLQLGEGIAMDLAAAREWYRKAAEGGDPNAMNLLADMAQSGKGGPVDEALASRLYAKGVENGDPAALRAYGLNLYQGKGVAKDIDAAAAMLQRSAAGYRQKGETGNAARIGMFAAEVLAESGRLEASLAEGRAAIADARKAGDRPELGRLLCRQAEIVLGSHPIMKSELEKSIFDRNYWPNGWPKDVLALTYEYADNYVEAAGLLQGVADDTANSCIYQAAFAAREGRGEMGKNYRQAVDLAREAITRYRKLGDVRMTTASYRAATSFAVLAERRPGDEPGDESCRIRIEGSRLGLYDIRKEAIRSDSIVFLFCAFKGR